jgi:hypothetical protein
VRMLLDPRSRISLAVLALALATTACPTEDEPEGGSAESGEVTAGSEGAGSGTSTSSPGSSEGSSSGADGSSSGGTEPACDCVEGADDFVDFVCDGDEICEPVQVGCSEAQLADCELADLTVVNPAVLECHHDALAAGTPQLLRWELPYGPDPGASGQRRMIMVMEGREAITWHEAWGVPSYAISDVEVVELRAAEHFDGCMELPSAEEVFRCLYDATEAVAGVCVPAHEFPIG